MRKIYHITSAVNWEIEKKQGTYTFCSLKKEGFIHCSTESQYLRVGNDIFSGKTELVLLEIDDFKKAVPLLRLLD